ncbi:RNA polymerase factor sigma-54 [Helicobacter turcicus]|uniref:RNA polymerase factor sigma-54 n=1 Tax=Helicobacter turcicus TaxID=2867412 RepID=A0ABS7JMM6_9HELI|nr:RNA polymerase factor sigma-54 [Helicobacter turcicus]MBX7490651.1 RNA polymerase factor sigma-54 [Helicobacter turcicus]MBX7545441.1 RNA polymerase factor sigma-54 [Helicobacter turcicus]
MKLRTQTSATLKAKLSSTLKSWLPILQSGMGELEETLNSFGVENPYFEVKSGIANSLSAESAAHKKRHQERIRGAKGGNVEGDGIEQFCIQEESLEEVLLRQIEPPLFPTKNSQEIAKKIIESLDDEGYFDGDCETIANVCSKELETNISATEVERIRLRFSYLEPPGIGALNVIESFRFQLDNLDVPSDVYGLCLEILEDLEGHTKFKKNPLYPKAMRAIQSFKNPPALDFFQKEVAVIPDILVLEDKDDIQVQINDKYYPSILIQKQEKNEKNSVKDAFIKTKIKEARDLVDALEMRKATLCKIGLMIVNYQYEFFKGGEIKPMTLKDLAEDLDHSPSTISRAISNKYLECGRGIFPLKNFFATAIDEETSNTAIKDFVAELIRNENKQKPLSDSKILKLATEKFKVTMVRRTIAKYRAQLNIASSSDRKKLYKIQVED